MPPESSPAAFLRIDDADDQTEGTDKGCWGRWGQLVCRTLITVNSHSPCSNTALLVSCNKSLLLQVTGSQNSSVCFSNGKPGRNQPTENAEPFAKELK